MASLSRLPSRKAQAACSLGLTFACAILFVSIIAPRAIAQTPPDRAAWMLNARWGVMTHYLGDWIARRDHPKQKMTVEEWNDLVDHFNVESLADQIQSTGAGYYLITIGQNSGFYDSPNATYDRITSITPSHCSRRDLIADLYEPLHRRGIKLMVYLPSGGPNGDKEAKAKLQWQNGPHRNREFQQNWEAIIREWSLRWGDKVVGCWFDGCYWPNAMYRGDEPNFHTFAAAVRAGDPNVAIAFNPGVIGRLIPMSPEDDYTAGETPEPDRVTIRRMIMGKVDGAVPQVLSFLGERWGGGKPRFATEQAVQISRKNFAAGAAVTWDVPIQRDGTIAQPFIEQLKAI